MKKQLHKIKIAAENFSRPTKTDKNSEELLAADRQVEKYKDVLDKICRKFLQNPSSGNANVPLTVDQDVRDKRCKKVHEYKLAQAMEESLKDLPQGLLRDVLENGARLEKNIAAEIVNNEINIENDVTKKLTIILENHIGTIQKQKRLVTKLMQDHESAKHKYQAAVRVNDNLSKINQLREEQEECESKLEKERDIWAAEMFELIAEEDNMANYIINYIKYQQLYYKSALDEIDDMMSRVNHLIRYNKKIFKVPLEDHLAVTNRSISYVIELCVCCLLEKGLYEEGLLRVGCAGSKLRRLRSAIDANLISPPFPIEYQDAHVIASVLKSYLRDLPDPLLTFNLYDKFIAAAQQPTEDGRKAAILSAIKLLPEKHFLNLRYLMKFLELLSQKHKSNKMSPQNIAIVMSPNLLWSPQTNDDDYASKVNSTASVNSIVEAMIADYSYFFGDSFSVNDFYVTLSRDELFPHNGGFPIDRELTRNIMTQSVNIVSSEFNTLSTAGGSNSNGPSTGGSSGSGNESFTSHTHSRSSSHDTSLILVDGGNESLIKRSQSNSSLSDASPPHSGSPKLPVRRKHNKQVAPTPPDNRFERANEHYASMNAEKRDSFAMKERFLNSVNQTCEDSTSRFIRNEMKAPSNNTNASNDASHVFKQPQSTTSLRKMHGSQENLISKPEKPPRPNLPSVESQTLIRNAFKNKCGDRSSRPIALPRNMTNVARSTENLSSAGSVSPVKTSPGVIMPIHRGNDNDDSDVILMRDNHHSPTDFVRGDKPAIPERPTSLIRPNFRTATFDKYEPQSPVRNHSPQSDNGNNSGIKKTQSFRMNSSSSQNSRDSTKGLAMGSITGRSLTTLERTHIYNVDKQQVAFVDVNEQQKSSTKSTSKNDDESTNEKQLLKTCENLSADSDNNDENQPPKSPRTMEAKLIKRPQIPAPPPPTTMSTSKISSSGVNKTIDQESHDVSQQCVESTISDSTKF